MPGGGVFRRIKGSLQEIHFINFWKITKQFETSKVEVFFSNFKNSFLGKKKGKKKR